MPRAKILSTIRPDPFKPPGGRRQIWLPNFTLTFIRTRHLPSNMAQFIVPLNLNKLDLKDYLWHAYKVPVLAIRSYIEQQRVQRGRPGSKFLRSYFWYRPRSIKRMTVEMADLPGGGSFVWPEEEKDLEPWDNETWNKAKEMQEDANERMGKGNTAPVSDTNTLSEQARALQQGRDQWRPTWREFDMTKRKAGNLTGKYME